MQISLEEFQNPDFVPSDAWNQRRQIEDRAFNVECQEVGSRTVEPEPDAGL